MGLALNFRHMYLILINRFITHNKGQLESQISIKRGKVEFSPGFQVQNANGLFAGGEDPEYIAHK